MDVASAIEPSRAIAERLARHEKALAEFLESAEALRPDNWNHAMHAGKWSPAEIVEHVRLSFVALRDSVQGGPKRPPVLTGWKAAIARWFFMPKILRTGRFPRGARAPRETRPRIPSASREEGVAGVRTTARDLEAALRSDSDPASHQILHPYFGPIPLPTALHLLAQYTRHHRKQLHNYVVMP
jgi:hypothetical protein